MIPRLLIREISLRFRFYANPIVLLESDFSRRRVKKVIIIDVFIIIIISIVYFSSVRKMIEVWIGIAAVLVAVLALLSFIAKSKGEDKDPPGGGGGDARGVPAAAVR